MEVILLENVEDLGEKNEVVEVADGYARNFLLPEGKAKMATESNLKELERKKEKEKQKKEERKKSLKEDVSELEGRKFVFEMKVGEKGQLFESITARDIAEKINSEGFERVAAKNVKLEKPIKEITIEEVELEFDFDLSAKIKIQIEEE